MPPMTCDPSLYKMLCLLIQVATGFSVLKTSLAVVGRKLCYREAPLNCKILRKILNTDVAFMSMQYATTVSFLFCIGQANEQNDAFIKSDGLAGAFHSLGT